jgi:hypothetical protein
MTIYDEVKGKLEATPNFRERKFRSPYLTILALRACGFEGRYYEKYQFSLQDLADFAIKFDSYRHAWGDVTREHKDLRGSDYGEGEVLEQEHILSLGYEVGFTEDIKRLKTIA